MNSCRKLLRDIQKMYRSGMIVSIEDLEKELGRELTYTLLKLGFVSYDKPKKGQKFISWYPAEKVKEELRLGKYKPSQEAIKLEKFLQEH